MDFHSPGFCLLNLGAESSSHEFRRFMIELVRQMSLLHRAAAGRELVVATAARFDQQASTKPHRDGGPDECLLMLGYEPSGIRAELQMSDYSRCAHELGLAPSEYLEKHNPMFGPGEPLLNQFTTPVTCFSNACYQILAINNSNAAYSADDPRWQGVLHTATILNPDESLRRVVNSMMIASVSPGDPEPVSAEELDAFVRTNAVRRGGYDKPNLADDV
jgi:hypothetical protein